ncbi:MAG TPA: site-2 protease family protein, partial [Saprospiraceae bacterium]|nr:site-2 protease family protein [Saprospiraceae bacterium]
IGLKDGDKILQIGNNDFKYFNSGELAKDILLDNAKTIRVNRNNLIMTVHIPDSAVQKIQSNQKEAIGMIAPRMPIIVDEVMQGSGGEKAGLQPNDRVISVNNVSTHFFHEMTNELQANKGKKVNIGVIRDGNTVMLEQVQLSDQGLVGFSPQPISHFYKLDTIKYSLGKALPAGFRNGYDFLATQISAFGQMFSGKIKASESLGGFASITKLFPTEWDSQKFWNITAILSLILGFMNLLPIPALDGGYIMFLLWEVITGRKVNDKVMEIATTAGMILLIGLLLYANGLDVIRALK